MPIEIVCPDCSMTYRVKDSVAGKSVTCKQCGAVLTVPRVARSESFDERPFEGREAELADAQDLVRRIQESESVIPTAEPLALGVRIRRFVISMLLLTGTLFLGQWIGGIVLDAVRSVGWPSTEGTVVRSEVIGSRKNVRLALLYRFQVDGRGYEGDQVTFAGNSPLFAGSAADATGNFPASARVPVFYNPRNPEMAALKSGIPGALAFMVLPLLLLGTLVLLFAWSSCTALFGEPRPIPDPDVEDPRSIPHRAGIAIWGVLIMLVFGGLAVMILMLPMTVPQQSRDAFTIGVTVLFGVIFAGLFSLLVWFGARVVNSAFKRPETINDMRKAPDTPKFSESSLICFAAGLGSSTAIILDRDKGKIHFKKCFVPRERAFLSGLNVPWWSCEIDHITGLSQMSHKGQTTFIIETRHGKASISTTINNYAELRHALENPSDERVTHAASRTDDVELPKGSLDSEPIPMQSEYVPDQEPIGRRTNERPKQMQVKTAYLPGQKPLDWRVGLCVVGGCFGPIVGMIVGAMFGVRDVGMAALWGIVLGGCSGLPFFVTTPRKLGRFVASTNGMRVSGGVIGLLVFLLLKFFIQTQFMDLLMLVGAGTVLGSLFAWQRSK